MSGSHLDHIWKSFGLHLEVLWATSGYDFQHFSKNHQNRSRFIRSIRDSLLYLPLASISHETYPNKLFLASVPRSRLQAPGSRLQDPGSRFQLLDSGFYIPGSSFQVPSSRLPIPGSSCNAAISRPMGALAPIGRLLHIYVCV